MVFKRSIDFQDSVRKIELILLATCAVEQWMRCLFVDGKDGLTILIMIDDIDEMISDKILKTDDHCKKLTPPSTFKSRSGIQTVATQTRCIRNATVRTRIQVFKINTLIISTFIH